MVTPDDIERLESFDSGSEPVLSTYLDLDPVRQVRRSYRAAFEDLVKQAREPLDKRGRNALLREVAQVAKWLEFQKPRGKGLAFFSCTPRKLWEAHSLPVRVRDHLAFEPKPDVVPLLELMDEYERYTVALVDKEKARIFSVFMGEVEESDAFTDLVPGKHDRGGLSQSNYQRHHEAHVYWHLKRVGQRLSELQRRRAFDRLILAGPEEATSELRHLLPRPLAQRIMAVIPAEMSAGDADIVANTLEIERRIERDIEDRLLAELLELAGGGGRATCGLAATLEALWLGAVQKLVVSGGVCRAGSDCPRCARLEPDRVATCPACSATMQPVHDLFHRAAERALEQAGSVETLHADAARRLMERGDGLGAVLRYRAPMAPVGNGTRP
ncbi:MAG: Vms1/Ankzf1 family peptidyl-tRNA hydrolase [Hyphomicrobium sp.]|uniref:baeRF10 domain-containing protein n=1 Tax=Hyphomicrobium sp. TaxID=82 RepID=UPI003D0F1751